MNLLRITIAICALLVGFAAVSDGFPVTWPYFFVWLLYWLTALVALYRFVREDGLWHSCAPAAICAATLLLVNLLPLDKLSRYVEFKRNEEAFSEIIERIRNGTLAPVPEAHGYGLLGRHYRTGNRKIAVHEREGKEVTFFFEFRSSDGPEGYVYDPSGAGSKSQLQRINESWYYGRP